MPHENGLNPLPVGTIAECDTHLFDLARFRSHWDGKHGAGEPGYTPVDKYEG